MQCWRQIVDILEVKNHGHAASTALRQGARPRLYQAIICKVGVAVLDHATAGAFMVFAGLYSIHWSCPGTQPSQSFQYRPHAAIIPRAADTPIGKGIEKT